MPVLFGYEKQKFKRSENHKENFASEDGVSQDLSEVLEDCLFPFFSRIDQKSHFPRIEISAKLIGFGREKMKNIITILCWLFFP